MHSLEILCGYGPRQEGEEAIKEYTECFDGILFPKVVLIVGCLVFDAGWNRYLKPSCASTTPFLRPFVVIVANKVELEGARLA